MTNRWPWRVTDYQIPRSAIASHLVASMSSPRRRLFVFTEHYIMQNAKRSPLLYRPMFQLTKSWLNCWFSCHNHLLTIPSSNHMNSWCLDSYLKPQILHHAQLGAEFPYSIIQLFWYQSDGSGTQAHIILKLHPNRTATRKLSKHLRYEPYLIKSRRLAARADPE